MAWPAVALNLAPFLLLNPVHCNNNRGYWYYTTTYSSKRWGGKIAVNFSKSSLVEISDNKLVAVEELCVENVLLKETPAAAILFDDAEDKERKDLST